jgi:lipopolysaccharide/colanic/teichoic acid biosynthesis glycosyltransferase
MSCREKTVSVSPVTLRQQFHPQISVSQNDFIMTSTMRQMNLTPTPYQQRRAGKRWEERLVALALCVLTLPLIALVALAIKCESPGPVISRCRRVGAGGQRLSTYKFRCGVAADLTRVGRFLRYTRIENLPQLINVLRGEMSIISRSERPFFLD